MADLIEDVSDSSAEEVSFDLELVAEVSAAGSCVSLPTPLLEKRLEIWRIELWRFERRRKGEVVVIERGLEI